MNQELVELYDLSVSHEITLRPGRRQDRISKARREAREIRQMLRRLAYEQKPGIFGKLKFWRDGK